VPYCSRPSPGNRYQYNCEGSPAIPSYCGRRVCSICSIPSVPSGLASDFPHNGRWLELKHFRNEQTKINAQKDKSQSVGSHLARTHQNSIKLIHIKFYIVSSCLSQSLLRITYLRPRAHDRQLLDRSSRLNVSWTMILLHECCTAMFIYVFMYFYVV